MTHRLSHWIVWVVECYFMNGWIMICAINIWIWIYLHSMNPRQVNTFDIHIIRDLLWGNLLKGIIFLLIHFIISFSSGSLTLSELGPVPLHSLMGCLEAVLVLIYLNLSETILSFRYMFWYRAVWLFGFGFRDKNKIQKYSLRKRLHLLPPLISGHILLPIMFPCLHY